ncbi:hypothetical protein [Paraglaciecola psychrophila]|uniref:Uncharacterized protein n=1 Tax=Paraglaciecola psychrophila 170 TaxID=1129794 RepID=K7AKX2_9ALTE|nr:hypothetical protein [Paraglaciecola psychrophila]AGH45592.1 hypothetical protein C427_3483 [Paraglaciecola psychrophila 170]GAC36095.1 hypothetical protein GPSY_0454 [Paraglaciecola psychrophila 170]
MKPFAATLGAGGITTAAETEKMNEQNTMLFTRELKYVFGLSIKLPFFENVVRIEVLDMSY